VMGSVGFVAEGRFHLETRAPKRRQEATGCLDREVVAKPSPWSHPGAGCMRSYGSGTQRCCIYAVLEPASGLLAAQTCLPCSESPRVRWQWRGSLRGHDGSSLNRIRPTRRLNDPAMEQPVKSGAVHFSPQRTARATALQRNVRLPATGLDRDAVSLLPCSGGHRPFHCGPGFASSPVPSGACVGRI
jgi:hypothetical protein